MEANTTYFVKASMDRRYRLEEHFYPNFIGLSYPNGASNGMPSSLYPVDKRVKKGFGDLIKWKKPYEAIYTALICTNNDNSTELECEVLSDRTIAIRGKEGEKLKLSMNFPIENGLYNRNEYTKKYLRGGWLITVESSKN